MPVILPLEWVVVGAAFVVFCIVPALLAWVDARRTRRRSATATAPAEDSGLPVTPSLRASHGQGEVVEKAVAAHNAEPAARTLEWGLADSGGEVAADVVRPVAPVISVTGAADVVTAPFPAAADPGAPSNPVSSPGPLGARVDALHDATAFRNHPAPLATFHAFRLQELRRVRLADWPPLTVSSGAERRQQWDEGQRLLEAEQSRIEALSLRAPFPPQAFCYAGADIAAGRARLRFLLFPGLWPSLATEAAALVIIDIAGGAMSGTVEEYHPAE